MVNHVINHVVLKPLSDVTHLTPPKKSFISRIPWFVIGARFRLLTIKVMYFALLRPVKSTYGLSAVITLNRSCVGSA